MALVPFKATSTMMVCGPTNSGKTQWIKRLIETADQMFTEPVKSVLYCYGVYQDKYDEMLRSVPNITFHEGIPSNDTLKAMADGDFHLVVIDDLMEAVVSDPNVQKMFTQYCHHYRFTAILVYQNIYAQGKCARSIAVNTHVMVLFKNKRDKRQVRALASQINPTNPKALIEAYEEATSTPYGYLVVDCSPGTQDEFSWRTDVFPGEDTTIYLPKA